jgi:hypothetical protein
MRYESNPMKTQLKLISCFAVMAFACGGLFLSASLRAQSSNPDTLASPNPDANKKEATASASPTPTASPRK